VLVLERRAVAMGCCGDGMWRCAWGVVACDGGCRRLARSGIKPPGQGIDNRWPRPCQNLRAPLGQ
jgi:hypothetical protein